MCVCIELLQGMINIYADIKEGRIYSHFVVLRVIKYEVFPDKPWLVQTKELGNGNETNWQYHRLEFREKGHGYYKAVQCLATSDDTASRLYIKFR